MFDIVRLYETRDEKNGKPGAGTISEAQLIGRGARYCPFRIDDEQPKYQRNMMTMLTINFAFARHCIIIVGTNRDISANYIPPCAKPDLISKVIVFVEPKGTHLIDSDKWKEDFLLELKEKAIPTVTFVDDNKYKIWGFHFFNTECHSVEFAGDMNTL